MDDAENGSVEPVEGAGSTPATDATANDPSPQNDEQFPATLVEISPGIAVVLGDVPAGLEPLELNIIPKTDMIQISNVLGGMGNVGSVAGNVGKAMNAAKGLYRVSDATGALLKGGAQLAVKDSANLGTVLQNGKILAQARFIPVTMTAATALATIGPAVAMLAIQMQISEISGLVRSNIALTTQTLKTIQNEQWSELEALVESLDVSVNHVRQLGSVPDSLWDAISSIDPTVRKQLKLYRKNVKGHLRQLATQRPQIRRKYLEVNAEAIVFDTHALLLSLKAHAEYQAIKALRARARGEADAAEAQLFEIISTTVPQEIQADRDELSTLAEELMRELRMIAELPGRATVPLTTTRKDTKAVQVTCAALIEAIEPIATVLRAPNELPATPEALCAPSDLEIDPYLQILRWLLQPGENLHGVAFPYAVGGGKIPAGLASTIHAKRVDASWGSLAPNKKGAITDKIASAEFVAVTDRRLISGAARAFLREAQIEKEIPLSEIRFVRRPDRQNPALRTTVSVTTDGEDIKWEFPTAADDTQIDKFVDTMERARKLADEKRHETKHVNTSKADSTDAIAPQ